MKFLHSLVFAGISISSTGVEALVTPSRSSVLSASIFTPEAPSAEQTNHCRQPSALWGSSTDSAKSEEELREEIADRNSVVVNEEKYALADGDQLGIVDGENVRTSSKNFNGSTGQAEEELQRTINRLVKTRAYPLFLAEKAAELSEGLIHGLQKKLGGVPARTPKSGKREKVVILGTGWGAASFLKDIDTNLYDVTVISPRNYFLFTPMLAGASVGTVEYRSITEPVREINRKAAYLEGTATSIDPVRKVVSAESVVCTGNSCDINDFDVPYDKLIVTIGAQTNTFGIPGVREYCNFLKQVEDAANIRTR